jgi:hypothetical protein
MSIDRITLDFLEALNQDPAMQEALDTAVEGAADPVRCAVEFARSQGFAVNAEALTAAKQVLDAALDDTALDAVAGGFNPQPDPPGRTSMADKLNLSARFKSNLVNW